MTPDQRAEFERRIIQRAFEAGVCGCDADPVLCAIDEEMGLGESVEYEEWVDIFRSLVARGILREEGAIPADFLALTYEEWGTRIASSIGFPGYVNIAEMIAKMLRGKQEKI